MHAGTYEYFSLHSFTCLLLQRMLQVQSQSCMLQFKQVLRCTFNENLSESFVLCFTNFTKSRIHVFGICNRMSWGYFILFQSKNIIYHRLLPMEAAAVLLMGA